MSNIKKITIIIICLVILIVAIVCALLYINKSNGNMTVYNDGDTKVDNRVTGGLEQPETDDIQRPEYNIVSNAITAYIQRLNLENMAYYGIDSNGNRISSISDEEKRQILIDLLSENYISNNNITVETIDESIDFTDQSLLYIPLQMKSLRKGDIESYGVYGLNITYDYQLISENCLIVYIDKENQTFSIEPTDKEYDELEATSNITSIQKNSYNKYTIGRISQENTARDYFNVYIRLALTKPEEVYNRMSKEYREKRFGTIDDYKNYVQKNSDEMKEIEFSQYLVNRLTEYTEYVAKDQYGNLYIFKEKKLLDFEIALDDYTLRDSDQEYIQSYQKLSDRNKVANNANIWVKMLNNRDYKSAFELLDETFRTTYFQNNVDVFEQIMREKYPGHYKIEFTDYSEETGIPIITFIMTDISGKSSIQIEQNVYMQLKEGTDFVMSFNVK